MRETHSRPHEAEGLVVRTVQRHGAALLRTARKHSLCADDAQDAYQRALEIFIRRADTLDAETAHQWLYVVVRNEAKFVREQRAKLVGADEAALDAIEARDTPSPEDAVLDLEDLTRTAEALAMLKPQEVTALWMQASGRAYKEIASELDWSYTKVNRCIAEGRKAFLRHYAAIDSGAACEHWAPKLSAVLDGEAGARDKLQVRRHLRNCPGCRVSAVALHRSRAPLALVLPGVLAVEPASADPGASVLVRVYEAMTQLVGEKTAASTMKLQAIADAASAGKVAAVAASAAAVAGGGAATVKDVVTPPKRQPASQRHASVPVKRVATRPIALRTPAPTTGIVAVTATGVARPSGIRAAAQAPAAAIVRAGRRERRIAAARRAAAVAAARERRRRPRTRSARAAAEFSGLPAVGGGATARRAAVVTPAPSPPPPTSGGAAFERASPRSSSGSTSPAAAAREFAP